MTVVPNYSPSVNQHVMGQSVTLSTWNADNSHFNYEERFLQPGIIQFWLGVAVVVEVTALAEGGCWFYGDRHCRALAMEPVKQNLSQFYSLIFEPECCK